MKLVHSSLETSIILGSETANIIVIENPIHYRKFVGEFYKQTEGLDGNFSLFNNHTPCKISKEVIVIKNFFDDFSQDKKILSALYKKLDSIVNYDGIFERFLEYQNLTLDIIQEVLMYVNMPIEIGDNPTLSTILKAFSVAPKVEQSSLLEGIIDYITIISELQIAKILVCFGLHSVFDSKELDMLYKHCAYQNICLFDFENVDNKNYLPQEKVLIIDKDLCEIVVNY